MEVAEGCAFYILDVPTYKNLSEEDDFVTAISYFFPTTWSSDEQFRLCGPLTTISDQMYRILGERPELIKLKQKKFAVLYTERHALGLGVPMNRFSDTATSWIIKKILNIIVFYYPTVDYLLSSVEKDDVITSIVGTILSGGWLSTEFLGTPFANPSNMPRRILLKCTNVVDFVARHNGILGCCITLQGKIITSNLAKNITDTIQFCIMCDVLSKKMGTLEQGCNFCPIFFSYDEYHELVETQSKRLCDIEWAPYLSRPLSRSDILLRRMKEIPARRRSFSRVSSCYGDEDSATTSERGPSPCTSVDSEASDSRAGAWQTDYDNAKELALCFIILDELCLGVIMESYASQESVSLARKILGACKNDLKDIRNCLLDQNSTTEPEITKENKLIFSSTTGKLQKFGPCMVDPATQDWIASTRNALDSNPEITAVTFKDSETACQCEKGLDEQKFTISCKN